MAICVQVSPNGVEFESRLIRTCQTLAESGLFKTVYFVGGAETPTDANSWVDHPAGFKYRLLERPKTSRKSILKKLAYTIQFRKQVVKILKELEPDLVAVRTLPSLPIGLEMKRRTGAKLMYDVHELETESIAQTSIRQFFSRRLERKGIPNMDGLVVVNNRIADWYRDKYKISRPAVVRAIPNATQFPTRGDSRILRETFNIAESDFVFVMQGLFVRGRAVEFFLEVFQQVSPDRHLVFMGYGPLEEKIKAVAEQQPNIHFHPAVPSSEVLKYTSSADVGIAGVESLCLSYYLSLPNKFMEYAFAGLPILAPDFPEMKDLVEEFQCGTTFTTDVAETAKRINSLTNEDIDRWQRGSESLRTSLKWSEEAKVLIDAYRKALNG